MQDPTLSQEPSLEEWEQTFAPRPADSGAIAVTEATYLFSHGQSSWTRLNVDTVPANHLLAKLTLTDTSTGRKKAEMVKLIPTRHPLVSDKSERKANRLLSGYSCDDGALTEDAVDGPEDSSWNEERSTGGARRSPIGLLSAIEEACVLSWPRDEKELTGYLAENDLYALTLRKGFREMEMRLREGHRLKWMNATWEEMMDAIPMHIYEAKNKNLVSLEDSLKWFSKWCKHQNIQEHELVENVHMVMNRMAPKKNCICFYG